MTPHPTSGMPDPRPSITLFAVAAVCLALLGLSLPAAAANMESFRHNPSLLVALHAFTLGITALEIGALYMLVPVVMATPPADRAQAGWQARLLGIGILLLLAGFWQWQPTLLIAGGTLTLAAVLWFAWLIIPGIVGQERRRQVRVELLPLYLAGAVVSLLLLALFGLILSFNLRYRLIPGTGLPQLAAHLTLGAGAWFGLAIIGLSYRMAAMFYLTPRGEAPRWAVWLAVLTVGAIALLALLLTLGLGGTARPLALGSAMLFGAYGLDFGQRLLRRQRRRLDPTLIHLFAAVGWLLAGCLLVGFTAVTSFRPAAWVAVGLTLLLGWVGNMAIGLSYKIIPFLSWHQLYAHLAARFKVPTLAQMLPPLLPQLGFLAWNAGLALLPVVVWLDPEPVWKWTAGALLGLGALAAAATLLTVLAPVLLPPIRSKRRVPLHENP